MNHAILAIELSTPTGKLAVIKEGRVLHESSFTSNRSHNSMLYAPLAEALAAANGELQMIVVGTGPGSYTGVRIAIAAAQGVAISRKVPVIGLSSLATLSSLETFHVVGDARRGQFYSGLVHAGKLTGDLVMHDEAGLRAWRETTIAVPCFTSDAVLPADLPSVETAHPEAVSLARIASTLTLEEVERLAAMVLEPFYLAEAFITKAKKK